MIEMKNLAGVRTMAKHLLILEEEKNILADLQTYLGAKGYGIYIADNVKHGFEVLDTFRIDGVLLSLDMFKRNNLQTLNDLRSHYPKIPVIAMSSDPSRNLVMESFAEGVRGHLAKPIVHQQLEEALFIFEGHLN